MVPFGAAYVVEKKLTDPKNTIMVYWAKYFLYLFFMVMYLRLWPWIYFQLNLF